MEDIDVLLSDLAKEKNRDNTKYQYASTINTIGAVAFKARKKQRKLS